jgi:creatinine amidohydrolase
VKRIADLTTEELERLLTGPAPCVALLPVGSVEPHGPHLPLGTDTVISVAAAERAAPRLAREGVVPLLAPPIPYGVTRFAEGFAGAISVPAEALTPLVRAVVEGYLAAGFAHVTLINNHLEPEHDAAIRAAIEGLPGGHASVACPLTRRWARTLSDEFRSGACHAGRYETSIVLAALAGSAPAASGGVDEALMRSLPDVDVSLSRGIRDGATSFKALGLDRAYTGAPSRATAAEGHDLLDRLAEMVVAEVQEGLLLRAPADAARRAGAL